MVVDKKDFELKNRKRFIGKITTGEYDAIVIGHTQFEKNPDIKRIPRETYSGQIRVDVRGWKQNKYFNPL